MRLHRLELAAFGPYPDPVVVDFDALGTDGLFLLYGDTGAGKTTILDAIAYALFGRVPGARQQAGRLRCDHADPGTQTQVTVELSLGERRLRVGRSPEWQRPKKRGEGTTKVQAKALLEEYRDGSWHGLATRIDEVSHQVQLWVGMSADQFFQVVLLPQGEFARFLRAESTEREELLEKLFGTQRFSVVENWLVERRKASRAEVAATEDHLRGVLSRLCQAAEVPHEIEPELHHADATWRAEITAQTDRSAAAAADIRQKAQVALREAQAEFERVSELRRRQQRRIDAEAQRADLEAGRAAQNDRLIQLTRARRAGSVVPLLTRWRSAVAAADRFASAAQHARESVTSDAKVSHVDTQDDVALRQWSADLRDEATRLSVLRDEAEQVPQLRVRLGEVERGIASIDADTRRRGERLAALPGEIAQARAELADTDRAGQRVQPLSADAERLRAALAAAREHTVTEVLIAGLRDRVISTTDSHQEARDTVLTLREQRLAGMAAELADELSDGKPCPVCGSADHPDQARHVRGRRVTDDMERLASATEERARADRETAEASLVRAEQERARLAALAGGRSEADLNTELAAVNSELATATAAVSRRDVLRLRLETLEAEQVRHAEDTTDTAARRAALETEATQVRAALTDLTDRLDLARGDDMSVASRLARISVLADAVDSLREATRVADDRRTAAAEARTELEDVARHVGFSSVDEVEAAALPETALKTLEKACTDYDRADAATAAALEDPELVDLDGITSASLVDVAPADERFTEARDEFTRAAAEAEHLDIVRGKVHELVTQFGVEWTNSEPVRQRADEIGALADLVAGLGQNARRMTLRAYVLSARLDEVARCASERLRRMSGGRYSFEVTDEADTRRVKAGLGLQVLDAYSGKPRSTKTLSGGESFMASLSLALGLADVVTAESGGTVLDTLFIDEGFGSLDADTLDLVMDTLDDLRAGGRVIGLVSHVEEMRQRIPMRLRVHRVGSASRLEIESR